MVHTSMYNFGLGTIASLRHPMPFSSCALLQMEMAVCLRSAILPNPKLYVHEEQTADAQSLSGASGRACFQEVSLKGSTSTC